MTRPGAHGRFRLVLLCHGQSEWNARNWFTGWVNVILTAAGQREASSAGQCLTGNNLLPDLVHTSLQQRSIRTAELALAECGRDWIPVRRSWRLNSNHYGALQGRDKAAVRAEVGEQQLALWRRSFDTLRALVRHLRHLSDEQLASLDIPTGNPLAFELAEDMHPTGDGGRYLRPTASGLDAIIPDR